MIKDKPIESAPKEDRFLYALDIGSSKLRLISGFVDDNKFVYIHGLVEIPSLGIKHGYIYDIELLLNQIACLIHEYQEMYQESISQIVFGVSGLYTFFENTESVIKIPSGIISETDRNQAIDCAVNNIFSDRKTDIFVMHVIPQNYQTESSSILINPVGLYAKQLKIKVHVIGCDSLYKRTIIQTIKNLNPDINISSFVYAGNAACSAVLLNEEKELGVVHLDIGGGTVNITVFDNNRQIMSFGLNYGGNYITEQISKNLSISFYLAELLKCEYGIADPILLNNTLGAQIISESANSIQFSQLKTEQVSIQLDSLTNVINQSLLKMFNKIFLSIEQFAIKEKRIIEANAGIVITGGSANLVGIENALINWLSNYSYKNNSVFKCYPRVRKGAPLGIKNTDYFLSKDFIKNSDKAVTIGLLREAFIKNNKQPPNIGPSKPGRHNILSKIKKIFF